MHLPPRPAKLLFAMWIVLSAVVPGFGQDLDGAKHTFSDAFLDQMVGNWKLTGNVMGHAAEHTVSVEWVLNHQFLRIHEKDNAPASNDRVPYEAMIMVGYDNTSERYVVHWNDVFGGRFSETLGYGTRAGDEIRFVFEYPDGPFHTMFRWNPETHQWKWLMQQKNKSGQWTEFADFTLTRVSQVKATGNPGVRDDENHKAKGKSQASRSRAAETPPHFRRNAPLVRLARFGIALLAWCDRQDHVWFPGLLSPKDNFRRDPAQPGVWARFLHPSKNENHAAGPFEASRKRQPYRHQHPG